MSPLTTPLLMMSPWRSGRYRLPIAPMRRRPEGDREVLRVGAEVGPQQADHRVPLLLRRRASAVLDRQLCLTAASRAARTAPEARGGTPGGRRRRAATSSPTRCSRRCSIMSRKTARPVSVGITRTTRRSSSSCSRSTRLRSSIRLTIPVALATETSSVSASLRHRERAARLEDGQDVEVDQAQRALQPRPEDLHPVLRAPRGHLADELGDDRLAVCGGLGRRAGGRGAGFGLLGADIQ